MFFCRVGQGLRDGGQVCVCCRAGKGLRDRGQGCVCCRVGQGSRDGGQGWERNGVQSRVED